MNTVCGQNVEMLHVKAGKQWTLKGHLNSFIWLYSYAAYAVAKWLRYCVLKRQVSVSIPDGDIEISQWKSFRLNYGPGVGSPSKRNEYQVYFLGVKATRA